MLSNNLYVPSDHFSNHSTNFTSRPITGIQLLEWTSEWTNEFNPPGFRKFRNKFYNMEIPSAE